MQILKFNLNQKRTKMINVFLPYLFRMSQIKKIKMEMEIIILDDI